MSLYPLKIYRIEGWYYFLGLPVLGFFMQERLLSLRLAVVLAGASFLLAYAFSLNNFFDEKMEMRNIVYLAIPLICLIPFIFFLTFGQRVLAGLFILLSTFYSCPKIRLKSIPVICSLVNAVGFCILFLLGIREVTAEAIIFLFVIFFSLLTSQLIHEMEHQEEDTADNINTTAVFLGANKVKYISSMCLLAATLLSAFLNKAILLLIGSCSAYLVFSIWKKHPSAVRRESRSIGIFAGILILVYFMIRSNAIYLSGG